MCVTFAYSIQITDARMDIPLLS